VFRYACAWGEKCLSRGGNLRRNDGAAKQIIEELLYSRSSQLTAVISANKHMPPHRRAPLEECLKIARELNPVDRSRTPIPTTPWKSEWGRVCLRIDPPLARAACQTLVARPLSASFQPSDFQFGSRGIPGAIAAVKKAVRAGCIYIAAVEIEDFCECFDRQMMIQQLPLPQAIVENVICACNTRLMLSDDYYPKTFPESRDLFDLGKRGILRGAACTPIVSEYFLAKLQWTSDSDCRLINYNEHCLLLASSEFLLKRGVKDLIEKIDGLPGGYFGAELRGAHKAGNGASFDFLGHDFLVDGETVAVNSSCGADIDAYSSFCALEELQCYILRSDPKPNKELRRELFDGLVRWRGRLYGWEAAFREANDHRIVTSALECIRKWCGQTKLSFAEVEAAVDPFIAYVPDDKMMGFCRSDNNPHRINSLDRN
jgi:hypothetical protein